MKGNPQNIEVGDVVSYTSIGDSITSVVLGICDQGYISPEAENSIDGYLVRATVMNRSTVCNYPVKDLTIVRKWNVSVPAEQVKQSEVKTQPTYSLIMKSKDESFETIMLAIELIEGLSSIDIVKIDPDTPLIEVTQNFVDKLCEFVNTKNHLYYPDCNYDVKFDGHSFWNNYERLDVQWVIDCIVDPIIVKELKRKTLQTKKP